MGVLIQRWVNINFVAQVSNIQQPEGGFIVFPSGNVTGAELKDILGNYAAGLPMSDHVSKTLQENLNQLVPGLAALLLTFLCMWLLKKKVSPIAIIFGLFAFGILGHLIGMF